MQIFYQFKLNVPFQYKSMKLCKILYPKKAPVDNEHGYFKKL